MGEPADFLASAQQAADAAGAVLRRWFRQGIAADLKGDASPVTIADRQAEQAMRDVLGARHPDHDILGEEAGLQGGTARYRWVLDPIDGTRAFITGRPSFGTLIALLDGATPLLGLIDQPIAGERWIGFAGRPTRFTGPFPGQPATRRDRPLAACELSCTSPQMFTPTEAGRWQSLARATGRASYGGDCYAYGLLALGQIDIVAEADLKIWDWAALLPIVTGAGGCMTDWEGTPLTPASTQVLALANPALLHQAVAALAPGAPD